MQVWTARLCIARPSVGGNIRIVPSLFRCFHIICIVVPHTTASETNEMVFKTISRSTTWAVIYHLLIAAQPGPWSLNLANTTQEHLLECARETKICWARTLLAKSVIACA